MSKFRQMFTESPLCSTCIEIFYTFVNDDDARNQANNTYMFSGEVLLKKLNLEQNRPN